MMSLLYVSWHDIALSMQRAAQRLWKRGPLGSRDLRIKIIRRGSNNLNGGIKTIKRSGDVVGYATSPWCNNMTSGFVWKWGYHGVPSILKVSTHHLCPMKFLHCWDKLVPFEKLAMSFPAAHVSGGRSMRSFGACCWSCRRKCSIPSWCPLGHWRRFLVTWSTPTRRQGPVADLAG